MDKAETRAHIQNAKDTVYIAYANMKRETVQEQKIYKALENIYARLESQRQKLNELETS